MTLLSIACFLYTFSYFFVRSMIAFFIQNLFLYEISSAKLTALCSIFNLTYALLQSLNGSLMEKYQFKFLQYMSFGSFLVLFLFKYTYDDLHVVQYFLPVLIGLFISTGSIGITYFCKIFFNGSAKSIGVSRTLLVVVNLIFIQYTRYLLSQKMSFAVCISLIQFLLFIAGVMLMFVENTNYSLKQTQQSLERRNIDDIFYLLCLLGVLSSFSYFFFINGFLTLLSSNEDFILCLTFYTTIGFGLGNLFVIFSQYVDFIKVIATLILGQIIGLINILFQWFPLEISCVLVGISYGSHLVPIPYIVNNYKNSLFYSGLFNSFIMIFSSFGLIILFNIYISFLGENSSSFFHCIKIIIFMGFLNLVLLKVISSKEQSIKNNRQSL